MRAAIDDRCAVIELTCVGICAGPVVVAHPMSDAPVVLSKIRTKQERKQFVRLVDGTGEVTDRSGSPGGRQEQAQRDAAQAATRHRLTQKW